MSFGVRKVGCHPSTKKRPHTTLVRVLLDEPLLPASSLTRNTRVPTRPRRLPIRLARTTPLTLARPAHALGLGTPATSPPVPNSNTNTMPRSHSLPSRVPPTWHDGTPLVLGFSQDGHGDLENGTARQPPHAPQYRPLLLHPTTRAAPPPQHNLDLALNDSDARFIAPRLVATRHRRAYRCGRHSGRPAHGPGEPCRF